MNTKKFISAVAASTILTVGAMAANPTVAANGLGDFLIAPAFFATGGYSSNVRVVNTDLTHSVLIRVAVRDSACSEEVDFPILLSPGDVWDASISAKDDGVYIHSSDDSNYIPQITTEKGLNLTNTNPNGTNGFQSGYVEFFPIAQFDEGSDSKVLKSVLATRWETLERGDSIGELAVDDVLSGFVNVVNDTTVKASMTIPMTAISGTNDNAIIGKKIGMSANSSWDVYFGEANAADILIALQANNVVIPYSDGGANNMVLFTFPNDQTCSAVTPQNRAYTVEIRDTEENQPLVPSPQPKFSATGELSAITPLNLLNAYQITSTDLPSFENGWIKVEGLTNTHNAQLPTDNIPSLISTQMKAVDVGGSVTTNWMYIPSSK